MRKCEKFCNYKVLRMTLLRLETEQFIFNFLKFIFRFWKLANWFSCLNLVVPSGSYPLPESRSTRHPFYFRPHTVSGPHPNLSQPVSLSSDRTGPGKKGSAPGTPSPSLTLSPQPPHAIEQLIIFIVQVPRNGNLFLGFLRKTAEVPGSSDRLRIIRFCLLMVSTLRSVHFSSYPANCFRGKRPTRFESIGTSDPIV